MRIRRVKSDVGRREVVKQLNRLLANEYLLRSKTRNYRWHLHGIQHHDLDEILKEQGRDLDKMIEEVVRTIHRREGSVGGSLTEVIVNADLIDDELCHGISPRDAVTDLLTGHQTLSNKLARRDFFGQGTSAGGEELPELLHEWSRRHVQMSATLDVIGENRLHLH